MKLPNQSIFISMLGHEMHLLVRDRSLLIVLAILVALLGNSLFNGHAISQQRQTTHTELATHQNKVHVQNKLQLEQILQGKITPEPFSNPADPANMGSGGAATYAIMPPKALSILAIGQSDLLPDHYKISYRNKTTFMYDTEIENPWNLLSGRMDVGFVITFLLPLLIFSVGFNLLAGEKEQGTLRLLLSNPIQLQQLIVAKLLARAVPILGVATIFPLIVVIAIQPIALSWADTVDLVYWTLLVLIYGIFWFALIALFNALNMRSAQIALALILAWTVLCLVIPVAIQLLVGLTHPAPSRAALSTQSRVITIEGLNKYQELLSTDYRYTGDLGVLIPENGKLEVPARLRAHYLMARDVDQQIEELLANFDSQVAKQQTLANWLGILSPAILSHQGIADLAGTGVQRNLYFKNQINSYHNEWRSFFEPKVLNNLAMQVSDFEKLPRFVWQEIPAGQDQQQMLNKLLLLLLPTVICSGLAYRRLNSYPIV